MPNVVTPGDGAALVTGASSGIGRAVALELAKRGWRVFALARREATLASLEKEADAVNARVVAVKGDVTDRTAMASTIADLDRADPIALAFLNAGAAISDAKGDLGGAGWRATFAVNVDGLVNVFNPLAAAMRSRGRGQIALMASMAGYRGLPMTGAYGPSKAAAIAFAESAHMQMKLAGVQVQLVSPGFVKSELTEGGSFPMPFVLETEDAARRIVDGFGSRRFEIAFPWPMKMAMEMLRLLPYPLYFALMSRGVRRG